MKIARAVTVNVEAAHMGSDGRMHGHSYLVECWTPHECCLIALEQRMRDLARLVDHTALEASVGRPDMESLGAWFLRSNDRLSRVVVRRPTLGYVVEVAA